MADYYSVSSHPGKTGTYFYTAMFARYGLSHSYTALGTNDLAATIDSLVNGLAAGISVSMPFKRTVIPLLTNADPLVTDHNSCNTILVKDRELYGHNADHAGVMYIKELIESTDSISIFGAGAIGSMISSCIPGSKLFSRSLGNWEERHTTSTVFINATGIGTSSSGSPVNHLPASARLVIDLAMRRGELDLQCRDRGITYVSGLDFYKHQFSAQFKIYTGIEIDPNEFDTAARTIPS